MTPLFVHVFHVVWCPFRLFSDPSSAEAVDLEMTWPSQWYFSGRWASQNEKPHWIDSDYVRRLKIAEQAIEGIRNSEFAWGRWYLDIYSHFTSIFWHQIWGETICEMNRWSLEATRNGRLLRPWMPSCFAVQHMLPQEALQLCWPKSFMWYHAWCVQQPSVPGHFVWKVSQFYEVKLPRC